MDLPSATARPPQARAGPDHQEFDEEFQDVQESVSKRVDREFRRHRKYIFVGFLLGAAFGIVEALSTGRFFTTLASEGSKGYPEVLDHFFQAIKPFFGWIIVGMAAGLLSENYLKGRHKSDAIRDIGFKRLSNLLKETDQLKRSFFAAHTYMECLHELMGRTWAFSGVVRDAVRGVISQPASGISIECKHENQYLRVLERCLKRTRRSFCAMLALPPSWFFDPREWHRVEYLDRIQKATSDGKLNGLRIMAVPLKDLIRDLDDHRIRTEFLERTASGRQRLYWGDWNMLAEMYDKQGNEYFRLLVKYEDAHGNRAGNHNDYRDYAVFDKNIAVQHCSSDNQIFVAFGTIGPSFIAPFDDILRLERRGVLQKLTLDEKSDDGWSRWKEKVAKTWRENGWTTVDGSPVADRGGRRSRPSRRSTVLRSRWRRRPVTSGGSSGTAAAELPSESLDSSG